MANMGPVRKLQDKMKRQANAKAFGTCKRFSDAALNGAAVVVVSTAVEPRLATRSKLPVKSSYVLFSDRRYRYR